RLARLAAIAALGPGVVDRGDVPGARATVAARLDVGAVEPPVTVAEGLDAIADFVERAEERVRLGAGLEHHRRMAADVLDLRHLEVGCAGPDRAVLDREPERLADVERPVHGGQGLLVAG